MEVIKVKADTVEDMIEEVKDKAPQLGSCQLYTIETVDGKSVVLLADDILSEEELEELRQLTSEELKMLLLMKDVL